MMSAYKHVDRNVLQQLEHIDTLRPEAFEELASKLHVEQQPAGRRLFVHGQRDHWVYYLLEGTLQLDYLDGRIEQLQGGDYAARRPLANRTPRPATALTVTAVRFLRIDANLLEMLSQDISPESYQLEEYSADDEDVGNRLFFKLYSDYMADTLKLPQLPDVALKVKQVADDPDGDLRTVARILQTSPVLPGQLMHTANSALYQLQTPVTSCLGAVTVLGMRQTRDLVITYTLRNLFRTGSSMLADRMDRLWRHSALSGTIAHALADVTPGLEANRALLLGLLHDIGVLPIIDYAGRFPELAHNPQQVEKVIKALRGQIGAMILRRWGFIDETVQVCLDAENWQRDPGERADYTDAVLVAQRLADALLDERPVLEAVAALPAFGKLGRGRLGDEEALQVLLGDAQKELAAIFHLD